jgi:hypothetical protein
MRGDRATRRLPAWRAAALLLAASSQTGCYRYFVPETVRPAQGRTFDFALTDQGRAALAEGIGAGTDRIEGMLVSNSDTTYTVRVAHVVDIRGKVTRWSGEVVTFRRAYAGTVRERQLSKSRTAVAIGGATAAVVALIATRGFGVVGNDSGRDPGEEPPPGEVSLMFPLTSFFNLFKSR